jgi:hypothetical protein
VGCDLAPDGLGRLEGPRRSAGRRVRPRASLGLAAALAACVATAPQPRDAPPGGDDRLAAAVETAIYTIDAPEISESSGLVASRRHDGVLWTHNDSGDDARIFAIDREGRKLAEYTVRGARNVDWEDIAIDDAGRLYIGDFGNNGNARRDLTIYVIPEPAPTGGGVVDVVRTLRFRYADQAGYPEARLDFDCEAMLYWDGALHLFSKHRGNTRTKLYRLPLARPDGPLQSSTPEELALEPLATIELGAPGPLGVPTGADISRDGRYVALLTYLAIFVYEREGLTLVPDGPIARIELDLPRTRQAESITWDGGALLFGNEQRALYRIETPLAPALWRFPLSDSANP